MINRYYGFKIFGSLALALLLALFFALDAKNVYAQEGAMVIKNGGCVGGTKINEQNLMIRTEKSIALQTPQGNITVMCRDFDVLFVDGVPVEDMPYIPPSRAERVDALCYWFGEYCPGTTTATPSGNIEVVCHCNGSTD